MSLQLVKKALLKFVGTAVPEVMCLRGKWGVGKTYAWKQLLREAIAEDKVALPSYSYVSLFGLNSIDELRQSIFENQHPTKGQHITVEDKLRSFGREAAKTISKYAPYAKIPYLDTYVQNLAGGFRHIVSESVKNAIICIDDFERKGETLRAADILGVVSQLKESKCCKILLILNRDALVGTDKAEFDKYFEKVIDATIDFEPTVQESLGIALKESGDIYNWLRQNCTDLSIANIRIVKKIERLALQIGELLQSFEPQLRKDVIRSLSVLAWSIYSREDAPPIEFLVERQYSQYLGLDTKVAKTEEQARWGRVLTVYGFTHCDEFDLALIDGIQKGFFDEERVKVEATKQQAKNQAIRGNVALTDAWRLYNGSFDSNVTDVAKQLFDISMENIKYLDVLNLNAAITILKDIGEGEKAARLLQHYLSERADEPGLFDLSSNPFLGGATDPDLAAVFAQQVSVTKAALPSPIEASKRLYKGGWSQEDEKALALLTVDNFYTLFKSLKDEELTTTVFGALTSENLVTPHRCKRK
jgi:hypothetical protein